MNKNEYIKEQKKLLRRNKRGELPPLVKVASSPLHNFFANQGATPAPKARRGARKARAQAANARTRQPHKKKKYQTL